MADLFVPTLYVSRANITEKDLFSFSKELLYVVKNEKNHDFHRSPISHIIPAYFCMAGESLANRPLLHTRILDSDYILRHRMAKHSAL